MGYIIMIMEGGPDPGLVPYTGVVHETKASALEEFLEAAAEVGRVNVYLTIV